MGDAAESLTSLEHAVLSLRLIRENTWDVRIRRDSHIYFMQETRLDGSPGHVKIGVANNLDNRLAGIVTSNPREITIPFYIAPYRQRDVLNYTKLIPPEHLERDIHRLMSKWHIRREWFHPGCIQPFIDAGSPQQITREVFMSSIEEAILAGHFD
jgi:hypothetical protein